MKQALYNFYIQSWIDFGNITAIKSIPVSDEFYEMLVLFDVVFGLAFGITFFVNMILRGPYRRKNSIILIMSVVVYLAGHLPFLNGNINGLQYILLWFVFFYGIFCDAFVLFHGNAAQSK